MGLPLRLGLETLGVGGAPPDLGGKFPPLAAAPLEIGSLGAGAPQGPYIKRGEGGLRTQAPGASLFPVTPLPLAELGEALPRSPLLPPPRRRAAGSPSTSPSPCWIKKEETSSPTVRVLNAEVSSVRH